MKSFSEVQNTLAYYRPKKFYKISPCPKKRSGNCVWPVAWGQCYKTFYKCFTIDTLFISGKPFQPSLKLSSKAGANLTEAPFALGQALCITHKY